MFRTVLFGSETSTVCVRQEHPHSTFHRRCYKHIPGISQQNYFPHTDILQCAKIPSMHSLFNPHRRPWLGHIRPMEDGRLLYDVPTGHLTIDSRRVCRPSLLFQDCCNRPEVLQHLSRLLGGVSHGQRCLASGCQSGRCRQGCEERSLAAVKRGRRKQAAPSLATRTSEYTAQSATDTVIRTLVCTTIADDARTDGSPARCQL